MPSADLPFEKILHAESFFKPTTRLHQRCGNDESLFSALPDFDLKCSAVRLE